MGAYSEYLLDVANITLIDNTTQLQLATATLKSHNISQSVDTTDIRGGQGNEVLTRIKSNKTVTITIEDVCHNRDFIAMAMGSAVETKSSFDTYTVAKDYTFTSGQITLDPAPKNQTQEVTYWVNGKKQKTALAAGKLTPTGASAGDTVTIGSYLYAAKAGELVSISSNKFSGTFTLVMEEPVVDLDLNVVGYKKSVFPRVQADDSFELSGSSERAESTISYTFTALKTKGSDELGYFYYESAK